MSPAENQTCSRWGGWRGALLGGVAVAGLLAIGLSELGHADGKVFRYLIVHYEPWGLLIAAVIAWISAVLIKMDRPPIAHARNLPVKVLAAGAFGLMATGAWLVCLNYPLSMDEFFADFQAKIFLAGHLSESLPSVWIEHVECVAPSLIGHDPATHRWMSFYFPVYAAMRTPFVWAGLGWLFNPLLGALAVAAIASVAGRIWPEERSARWAAALMLALAPQFLLTGMTAYAMTAYLLFNLVWLRLYLANRPTTDWAAATVGVLAVGLHQPVAHLLFAAPLLLRLVTTRRWRRCVRYLLIYGAGGLLWLEYVGYRSAFQGEGETALAGLAVLALPWPKDYLNLALSLVLLCSWQTVAALAFAGRALREWRRLSPVMRDLTGGLALTAVFYLFFPSDQGHGWGARYLHSALGNLVLLATAGWVIFLRTGNRAVAERLLVCSVIGALALQIPYRAWEVRHFTTPFARASRYLQTGSQEVTVVEVGAIWLGNDLIRNDPDLQNRPLLVRPCSLPEGFSAGRVDAATLKSFGLRSRAEVQGRDEGGLLTCCGLLPRRGRN